jgi:hypothetical protein
MTSLPTKIEGASLHLFIIVQWSWLWWWKSNHKHNTSKGLNCTDNTSEALRQCLWKKNAPEWSNHTDRKDNASKWLNRKRQCPERIKPQKMTPQKDWSAKTTEPQRTEPQKTTPQKDKDSAPTKRAISALATAHASP